jgi:asparagine synthase (glutamine-hydrolysing)
MCGINGIINFNNQSAEETLVRKMMQIQKHRGPDDEGVFIENNVGLGFVRLSILDLSPAGHQPMFSHNQRYVIVFNGEIFNYIELRGELKSHGYNFKTSTDTEVLLASYQQWGEECLHRFNGMWAFVIYDRKEKTIFAARDRYGIKPFYYYLTKEFFAFASEIPPILPLLPGRSSPDNQSIFDYLVFNRTDQNENTFFSDIKKLQHGYKLKIQDSKLKIEQWYNLQERIKNTQGFESPEEFRDLFSSAVGLRLRSDVPVGVCLSGGLDSSAIVSSILSDHGKRDLQTFSVTFGENIKTDERKFMQLYANKVFKQYYNEINAQTFIEEIQNFVAAIGEPVPSGGPFAQFNVMKIAKGKAVVLLDGQGADEILGGYKYFWGYYYNELLRKFQITTLLNEIKSGGANLYKFSTSLYYALPPNLRTLLSAKRKGNLISREFKMNYATESTLADDLYTADNLNDALLKHIEFKLEHLLKWEDRNSMWFSLESRVPFMDYRLVEKALKTSSGLLMKNGYTKSILRESMLNEIPREITDRKEKIGFGAPKTEWFKDERVNQLLKDVIFENKTFLSNYFEWPGIVEALNQQLDNKKDNSHILWKIFNLALWQRCIVENSR